ncbi:DUF6376 family protein [Litchfieldia alkalitelluris]|uniref:DUF6376 family protein n=1 Tax=Litchfieldia alkalitelluris TaxID=304268 RepID=UPI001F174485|nr:DUF6376 family protein [Litchfieldia alkalitelluris]
MYKKRLKLILITTAMLFFLGGCSFIEDVNNSVNYVNEATAYVNEVSTFVKEVPPLAEQAISDEQALAELEIKLEDMKSEIVAFNELKAPELATEIHEQIVTHNNQALDGIESYLSNIENGKLDPAILENSDVYQSFREITNTIDEIKQLGQ